MKLLTLAAVLLVAAHIPMAGSDPIYEPILPDPSPGKSESNESKIIFEMSGILC